MYRALADFANFLGLLALFFFQVLVVVSQSGLHVRAQDEETDTEGQQAQDYPSNETEEQVKELCLVAIGHLPALCHSVDGADLRVVLQDEVCHEQTCGQNDAWHDKQAETNNYDKIREERCQENAQDVLVAVEESAVVDLLKADEIEEIDNETPAQRQEDECQETRGTITHRQIVAHGGCHYPVEAHSEKVVDERSNDCLAPLALQTGESPVLVVLICTHNCELFNCELSIVIESFNHDRCPAMLVLNLTILDTTQRVKQLLRLGTGLVAKRVALAGVEVVDI